MPVIRLARRPLTAIYDTVPRPILRGRATRGLTAQLRATAETGLAIKVPLAKSRSIHGGAARQLRAQGYRVHQQRDGDFVLAWCEPIHASP
jgi:hypothetical protein